MIRNTIHTFRSKCRALVCSLLTLAVFPQFVSGQAKSAMTDKPFDVTRWIETHFAKGKIPPFSFVYDGKPSRELLKKWKYTAARVESDEPEAVEYLYTYLDRSTGLQVECRVKGFTDFDAVEWVLNFKNDSQANSASISQVKVVDLDFEYPQKGNFILHYADGSHVSKHDFHQRTKVLAPGDSLYMAPQGGRSSQVAFPFFNIESPAGQGVMVAVGWTGTWFADIAGKTDRSVTLASGMKYLDTYLYPQESIRTPSICLLFWKGDDRMVGHNRFRRFVMAHHTPKVDGKPAHFPESSSFNYGDPSPCNEYTCLTADYAIALIRRYKQFDIVPEVFWLDAGWYSQAADYKNHKNWANTVGNWTVDREKFPDGLKPVSDEAHKVGAKFMVWFEPERVIKGSQWAEEHPEWMLDAGTDAYLFDLGNPKALEWFCNQIGELIEQNGIDYYRQDFNMEPDIFWQKNDEPGRTGIREIRHIEGLYAFWDYLRQRFPGLLVDNCASGGRRIDLEATSRSAPMWRTDYNYGEPVGYQCHTYGLEMYLPQHGTGVQKTDKFTFRSSLGTSVVYNWKITNGSSSFYEIQDCMKEFREVRPYFYEDYYPLTGSGDITGDNIWMAYQLYRPSDKSGFVVAFRREACPDKTHTVKLSGLDPDAVYSITNKDTGETVSKSGRELAEGFVLTLDQPRSSLLLKYQAE